MRQSKDEIADWRSGRRLFGADDRERGRAERVWLEHWREIMRNYAGRRDDARLQKRRAQNDDNRGGVVAAKMRDILDI